MKKLLAVVLFLVLLCGCQGREEETFDRSNRKNVGNERMTATPEPTDTPIPEPTKTSPGWSITYVTATPRPTATSTPIPTPTMVPYVATEEILVAEEFSGKVQIMDTVFQFPCRLKELMVLSGVTIEQYSYASINGYDPLNDTYAAESRNTLVMTFADESECRITVENKDGVALALEEMYVTELYSESPCLFFPKGICVGVHCAVLKEWKEYDSMVSGSSVACYKYQEAECKMNYSTLELGSEFAIDVNNTTYNIDAVEYIPSFYVSMDQMTEMVQNYYPKDLAYRVPIILSKSWRTGLIVHEGRRFAVTLEESWMYDNPQTKDELLVELGRELRYYNEEWDDWYYYTDTSDDTNEKIVVKEEESLTSVVNFWDYADYAGVESITLEDGKQVRPEHEQWKRFADVAVMYGGYLDMWKFTLEPLDRGDVPEEVETLFREVVLTMATSVREVEE